MKQSTRLHILALAIWAGASGVSLAQSTAFTYQGRLDDTGASATGSYDISFAAYDAPTNGNLVSVIVTNSAVNISNGLFTTTVDFGNSVFTGGDVWLEIAVSTNAADTFSTIIPRQQFSPTPYALYSQSAFYAQTAGAANAVASSTVSVPQLNTVAAPASGQVLAYNGTQLVWQDPVIGGSTGGWSLSGNLGTTPGVNFLGTSDNQALVLKAGGVQVFQLQPDTTGAGAPNIIGGAPANFVKSGVIGATIGGGGAINYASSSLPFSNCVMDVFGTVSGGAHNIASNQFAVVSGGAQNMASGYISTVSGGAYNVANANEAFVGGGAYNVAGFYSVVAGGDDNLASGPDSVVVGGLGNTASGYYSFVGGGNSDADSGIPAGNIASGDNSVVVGGDGNQATDYAAAVGGGVNNIASGAWSTVPGGANCLASGVSSFAAGYNAHASTPGSFVWADTSSSLTFTSTASCQFLIRATGGVGIGTPQPPPNGLRVGSGGLAVTGASSPNYPGAAGVFIEKYSTTAGAVYAYDYNAGGPLPLCFNSPGGNVGIGTLSPAAKLTVHDSVSVSDRIETTGGVNAWTRIEFANPNGQWNVGTSRGYNGDQLYFNRNGVSANALALQPSGDATFSGNVSVCSLSIRGGCDLAEPFATTETEIEKGSVVVIDPAHPGQLKLSGKAYDTRVAGIVSGANGINPGIAMHQEGALESGQNVALSGRVYVQADASNGAIEPGDLLTTSEVPGHAMKVTDHARAQGAVIGKAMTGLVEGRGMILVLVTLQ